MVYTYSEFRKITYARMYEILFVFLHTHIIKHTTKPGIKNKKRLVQNNEVKKIEDRLLRQSSATQSINTLEKSCLQYCLELNTVSNTSPILLVALTIQQLLLYGKWSN